MEVKAKRERKKMYSERNELNTQQWEIKIDGTHMDCNEWSNNGSGNEEATQTR